MSSMKDQKELPKTYGEKPAWFMFAFDEEPQEKYYIGSEVGKINTLTLFYFCRYL